MVGASRQSCSSEPSGMQWVVPSHLSFNGIGYNWHWNWPSTIGLNDVETFAVDVDNFDVSGVDVSVDCWSHKMKKNIVIDLIVKWPNSFSMIWLNTMFSIFQGIYNFTTVSVIL